MDYKLNPIYLDNHLFIVEKPAGMLVQGDATGDRTLLDHCKQYVKQTFHKRGEAYLGLIHRLDRPVSGIIVFARTSKAASRLSTQWRNYSIHKKYAALVKGKVPDQGEFRDYLVRRNKVSRITNQATNGKMALLYFKRNSFHAGISYVDIELITGRHHQIRVQFAARQHPIIGDLLYGSKQSFKKSCIALHSYYLSLQHPITNERLIVQTPTKDLLTFYKKWKVENSQ